MYAYLNLLIGLVPVKFNIIFDDQPPTVTAAVTVNHDHDLDLLAN